MLNKKMSIKVKQTDEKLELPEFVIYNYKHDIVFSGNCIYNNGNLDCIFPNKVVPNGRMFTLRVMEVAISIVNKEIKERSDFIM